MSRIGWQVRKVCLLRQDGAVAVEFILIFPVLFAIMYCTIVYGYTYMLQQSINFAAQQGAQAAVAVIPTGSSGTTSTAQNSAATTAVGAALSWLPASQQSMIKVPAASPDCLVPSGTQNVVAVEVQFAMSSGGTALFPQVSLPLVGTFPFLPNNLFACAVAYT